MTESHNKTELFLRYLEVCNRAIEANKFRFPYKQILGSVQKILKDSDVEVCIIDDRPEPEYVIQLADGGIRAERMDKCKECGCKKQWRVARSYLEDVTAHPEEYIRNPAKINWEWVGRGDGAE